MRLTQPAMSLSAVNPKHLNTGVGLECLNIRGVKSATPHQIDARLAVTRAM